MIGEVTSQLQTESTSELSIKTIASSRRSVDSSGEPGPFFSFSSTQNSSL